MKKIFILCFLALLVSCSSNEVDTTSSNINSFIPSTTEKIENGTSENLEVEDFVITYDDVPVSKGNGYPEAGITTLKNKDIYFEDIVGNNGK